MLKYKKAICCVLHTHSLVHRNVVYLRCRQTYLMSLSLKAVTWSLLSAALCVSMWLSVRQGILDTQPCSFASHVISEDLDLYLAYKHGQTKFFCLSSRRKVPPPRSGIFKYFCCHIAIFSLYRRFSFDGSFWQEICNLWQLCGHSDSLIVIEC